LNDIAASKSAAAIQSRSNIDHFSSCGGGGGGGGGGGASCPVPPIV